MIQFNNAAAAGFHNITDEDTVLAEFSSFFDQQNGNHSRFSLDDEDLPALRQFVELLSEEDRSSTVYVCTYGYELTDSKGEKFIYADCLWLDTVLDISELEALVLKSGVPEPSDISFLHDCNDIKKNKIWLIASDNGVSEVFEFSDQQKVNHMIQLYWD